MCPNEFMRVLIKCDERRRGNSRADMIRGLMSEIHALAKGDPETSQRLLRSEKRASQRRHRGFYGQGIAE